MLSAVHYLHQHGVVHRDIKFDNFLFDTDADDAELKLIDFGLAKRVAPGGEDFSDGCGTVPYMAPEMFLSWHQERRHVTAM